MPYDAHDLPLVYLETSFISACVTDRPDHASVFRKNVSREWWNTQAKFYKLATSAEVLAELSRPGFRRSREALQLAAPLPLLPINEEVQGLATLLVNERIMPGPVSGDAIHVAAAMVHEVDYLLSWNVRHLANPNKVEHLRIICVRLGLIPPQILTPDQLWEERNA